MDPSLDTVIAATVPLQAILESPQPSTPPLPPTQRKLHLPRLDRRRSLDRWVEQRPSGRWALLNSRGKPPTGSYGSIEAAIKVVVKRRAARDKLKDEQRRRKEAREAVKAAQGSGESPAGTGAAGGIRGQEGGSGRKGARGRREAQRNNHQSNQPTARDSAKKWNMTNDRTRAIY
jgi:hypothetical protein